MILNTQQVKDLWECDEPLEFAYFQATPDSADAPMILSTSVSVSPMAVGEYSAMTPGHRFKVSEPDGECREWEIVNVESYAGGEGSVYAAVHVIHCSRVTVEPDAEKLADGMAGAWI